MPGHPISKLVHIQRAKPEGIGRYSNRCKKMLQVESSKVCQDVNFLSRSMKIELVPYVIRILNIELNCQYANIQIRTSE